MKEKDLDKKLSFCGKKSDKNYTMQEKKDIVEKFYNNFVFERIEEVEEKYAKGEELTVVELRDLCAARGIANSYGKNSTQLKTALEKSSNNEEPDTNNYKIITRTLRVRVLCRNHHHHIFNQWYGVCRRTYNDGVSILREKPAGLSELNKQLVTDAKEDWKKAVPTRVRKGSIEQVLDAYHSNLEKKKKNPNHKFKLRFRRYDSTYETIIVKKEMFNLIEDEKNTNDDGYLFHTDDGKRFPKKKFSGQDFTLGKDNDLCKKGNEFVPLTLSCKPEVIQMVRRMKRLDSLSDMTLTRSRDLKRYWLNIPYSIKIPVGEQKPLNNLKSLDPGVRTFQTWYTPDGSWGKIGYQAQQRLKKINTKIFQIQSELDTLHNQKKPEEIKSRVELLKMRSRRLYLKKRFWIQNSHYDTCKELTTKKDTLLLLPSFNVSDMIKKKEKKHGPLNPITRQSMMDLSFYRFKTRLDHYLEKNYEKNCHVKVVLEPYTTKTCGKCGILNFKTGGKDTFKCKNCKAVIDRDVNGARNNMLAEITEELQNITI